jgi:short-subunit dehydrogenase
MEFSKKYGPWAVIAGGSDGIGECFARELASRGVNLLLVARRAVLLETLAKDIRAKHGTEVRALALDLTSDSMGERLADATADLEVGLLVYNAGAVHGAKKFLDQPLDHGLGLVRLNCVGPMRLVHHFGRRMRERGRGGVLLVSSLAALSGASYIASYAATKSFDLIFAEALWHELAPAGVDVLCAIVGATRTPSMLTSNDRFEAYPGIMEPREVAAGALDHLGRGPSWVPGSANVEAAKGMWPVSRVEVANAMSEKTAQLYGIPHVRVPGVDYFDV